MSELVMPYGAYKGTKIEDLPTEYLRWVAENFTNENSVLLPANRQLRNETFSPVN